MAGGPAALVWSPTNPQASGSYDYGTLDAGVGASQSVTFTLTNSGGMASGTLATTLTGSSAFEISGDTCTALSVGPKKTCTVTVNYDPTTAGESDNATLTATGEHGASVSITLTGNAGTPHLKIFDVYSNDIPGPGEENYKWDGGPILWRHTFTVTNVGTGTTGTLQLTSLEQMSPMFVLSFDTCSGTALAPTGTCRFDVTFNHLDCPEGQLAAWLLIRDSSAIYISLNVRGECTFPPIQT